MTPEELGLPPMFEMTMQMPDPMSQSGAFVEKDGKFCLLKARLNQ